MSPAQIPTFTCQGCGAVKQLRHDLVKLEDNRHRLVAELCRGRYDGHPKNACLAKFLLERDVRCVVCDRELRGSGWHQADRVRPVCGDCEVKLAALADREKGRRWYGFDVWELFGEVTPRNVHADYSNLGACFLKALGDLGPRVNGAEWITEPIEGRHRDRYCHATIELTERQAEGVREFAAKFAEYVDKIATAKHAEGGSLLVKLARGEVTIDDFDQQVAAKGAKR